MLDITHFGDKSYIWPGIVVQTFSWIERLQGSICQTVNEPEKDFAPMVRLCKVWKEANYLTDESNSRICALRIRITWAPFCRTAWKYIYSWSSKETDDLNSYQLQPLAFRQKQGFPRTTWYGDPPYPSVLYRLMRQRLTLWCWRSWEPTFGFGYLHRQHRIE